ncbi:MAG: TonB-dependent receptor [Muribaculaceae bacterium]|nr:TonB-dependent receptor [Muribaculaceae bacterium]
MKKILVCICTLSFMGLGGYAQELNKEITLEKDFVPVEKKATKKSALPVVVEPTKNETPTTLKYSDWAQPTAVATSIPTMLPYGYRTSHIFSDKRGYFDFGVGTQLNMAGSVGYRLIDKPETQLGVWLQHNSTWSGKNTTTIIPDEEKQKQKFNDNVVGLDLTHQFSKGTLDAGATVHFDKFNYYGGMNKVFGAHGEQTRYYPEGIIASQYDWDDNKQSFIDLTFRGKWQSHITISDRDFDYYVGMRFNHAGYSKSFTTIYDGAKENHINANVGAAYQLSGVAGLGADVAVDYLGRKYKSTWDDRVSDDMTMITLHPYYSYVGERASASLGVNLNFSFSDGAAIRLSPNVKIDYNFVDGAALYAEAQGGKRLNTLSSMAALNRYSDPLGGYCNTFVPIDAEAGFKIGPFRGLSLKLYGGYGIFKNDQLVDVPCDPRYAYKVLAPDYDGYYASPNLGFTCYPYNQSMFITENQYFAPVYYKSYNTRGVKFGAELNYKYRSLAELDVKAVFAPQGKDFDGKYIKGYTLGLDRAKTVVNVDLKVNPMRALTVNLGFDYRGGRYNMNDYAFKFAVDDMYGYSFSEVESKGPLSLSDVVNLRAGASYRFDKTLTLWVQASNLLNKQWDETLGMGAQKLGFMGGLQLVF